MRLILLFALALTVTVSAQAADPNAARDAKWREEIRHALHVPDTLPALDAKVWGTFSPTPGVLADRVTYSTADGMIVPAIVYRPDPKTAPYKTKLPGIVIVNGHGGDQFSWYAFYSGMMFAKAGAVVVTYSPIGDGERNAHKHSRDNPSPHDVYPPTPAGMTDDAWHMEWGPYVAGLMQVDLAQAVSYLLTLPEVDSRRIATAGYSMGSFVSGIEGAWDTRVHAVLLSGGGVYDGPGEYYDAGKLPCQATPYRALLPLGDRGAILYALNAQRGPMYVMNGSNDTVMDIPHHGQDWFENVRGRALKLVEDDSAAKANMFTTIFFPGINHRTSWVKVQGVEWLNSQLHFAFWNTDAKIEAQGTTHISTWIKANDVDISKNYIREDREGGLDAVGQGLPGIPRADLMVLPDAEWERLKDRIVWEGWEQKMLSQLHIEAPAASK